MSRKHLTMRESAFVQASKTIFHPSTIQYMILPGLFNAQ